MKYWRGYIAAALFAALAMALTSFSKAHGVLVDMIYPYVSRLIQTSLSGWVSGGDFCLWQVLLVLLGVAGLASVVLMILFRWNFVQWLGWVLACVSLLSLLHTGIYGLNQYAGPLADDVRLSALVDEETGNALYLDSELVETTAYLRDIANELSLAVPRNADGSVDFPAFSELAEMAADGYDVLVYDKTYSVFAGATDPVKELGWASMYTNMGVTGMHVAFTGEAAVNPKTPAVAMPHIMCREMAHRMCIANDRDANLAAFLACDANPNPIFRYSGYFMAFRYCYHSLIARNTSAAEAAAAQIYAGATDQLKLDLAAYDNFFDGTDATDLAGDEEDVNGNITDLMVSWYVQEIYLPAHKEEDVTFDPENKDQIDLTTPDVVITPTEETTEGES